MIIATPAPEGGGVGNHMLDLGRGLRARGHDVALGLWPDARDLPRQAEAAGLSWMPLTASLRAPADVWHLHLHNTLDTRALPLMLGRRAVGGGARVLLTEHLPRTFRTDPTLPLDPTYPPARKKPGARQLKWLMKRGQFAAATHVIVPSRGSGTFLTQAYGLPTRRIAVVHNGLAPPEAPPSAVDRSEPLRVAVVGALTWRKGVDVLLEARAGARRPWHVTVVGDGPAREELERQADGLPDGAVTFAGWLDDPDAALRDAHLLAVPSRSESFSYVTLEAMLRGRGVVATRVDGPDELVRDGVDGQLLEPEDPAALRTALDALAADRDAVAAMGAAAYERASERFTVDRMVDALLDLYTS
ncbi:MAG TPA: glycosyltransferase family 4 protein [Baekduia sp.]|nr:glycosyltransferase family 4 protein [Baekduia sp.]